MNSLRFSLFVIVLVVDGISYGHGQLPARRDEHEQDVKNELLKLLIPNRAPEVVEDPSVELKESNLIDTLQYLPIHKSPRDISNNFEDPSNNDGRDDHPWLAFDEEDLRGGNSKNLFRKNTNFVTKNGHNNNFEGVNPDETSHQYEVKEEHEEQPDFHFFHHNHEYHQKREQDFEHAKHGFHHGSDLHHHHHHGHYNEHNPGCFPHRRRPPPRPRPTGTTTASSATESVDPRMSTVAGFMATQVPRIDIRGLI